MTDAAKLLADEIGKRRIGLMKGRLFVDEECALIVAALLAYGGSQYVARRELLDKCIMALSGQYVNADDNDREKEAWNAAVGYCIGSLRAIQESGDDDISRGSS